MKQSTAATAPRAVKVRGRERVSKAEDITMSLFIISFVFVMLKIGSRVAFGTVSNHEQACYALPHFVLCFTQTA